MTIDRIIANSDVGALVAGLAWRPVTGGKHTRKSLDEARQRLDATHYVTQAGEHAASYGFFAPRPAEEGQKLPKGAASVAAVFAQAVGSDAPNAALVLSLGDADRLYLVTLDDGVPTLDMISDRRSVLESLGEEARPIWTDLADIDGHEIHASVDLQWLKEQEVSKSTRLLAVPVDVLPAVLATVILVSLVGGWYGWTHHKKAVERQRLEQEAMEADPLPKYMSALSAHRPTMFSDRNAALQLSAGLTNLPAKIFRDGSSAPIWVLFTVECESANQYCDSTWLRTGGSFAELQAAFPGMKLIVSNKAGVSPSLDQGVMRFAMPWARNPKAANMQLPTFERAFSTGGSTMQLWKTAGMSVDMKPPTTWPKAAGVPDTFSAPNGIGMGEFTVSMIPGMFLSEVIQGAPAWMSWEYLRLEISSNAATPATSIKYTLRGNYYVASK
jgi:hypothetical protein